MSNFEDINFVTRVRNIVDGTLTTVTGITNTIAIKADDGTFAVYFSPANPTVTASPTGTTAVYFDQSEPTVKAEQSGTYAVYFDQSDPKVNVGTDVVHTKSTILISGSATGSYTGTGASGKTLASPISGSNIKVFAYSIQTTGITGTLVKFTNGGASSTDFWSPLATPTATASETRGANMAVEPPGYIFSTGTNTTLAIHTGSGVLVHYSVSYFRESA